MFSAGSITSEMTLDTAGFTSGFAGVVAQIGGFPGMVASFMANPLLGFADVAVKAMGLVTDAIAGVFKSMQSITDAQDNLNDLSEQLGVSVEYLDALGKAGEFSGTGTEGVAQAMLILSKRVTDAAEGSDEARASFRRLGIDVIGAGGHVKGMEEIMGELMDSLSQFPAGAERSALAMDLFGRSGNAVANFLAHGRGEIEETMQQLVRYGAVTKEQAAKMADEWNDVLKETEFAWLGIKMALAQPLRDSLLPYLKDMLAWIRENQPAIRDAMNEMALSITGAVDRIGVAVQRLQDILGAVSPSLGLLGMIPGGWNAQLAVANPVVGMLTAPIAPRSTTTTNISPEINLNVDPRSTAAEVLDKMRPHIERALSYQQEMFDEMQRVERGREATRRGL